jgi:hypothetical protein
LNSFEGEVSCEVTQASSKFRCNMLGESGDRLVRSLSLSRGLSSSRVVLENRSNRFADQFGDWFCECFSQGVFLGTSSGNKFPFGRRSSVQVSLSFEFVCSSFGSLS